MIIESMIVERGLKGTRSGDTFIRPNISSVYKGEQSLRSFGPIVWNTMLSEELKSCKSLSEFKNRIKSWTPSYCPCKPCKTFIPGLGYGYNVYEYETLVLVNSFGNTTYHARP